MITINNIRNEFVHFKFSKEENNLDPYLKHFEVIINLDLKKAIEDLRFLMELVAPKYFEEG
jgi:hypothetical protein